MSRFAFLATVLAALCVGPVQAQFPPPQPLAVPLPPLLFVKVLGPKGMQGTFFRAGAKGETFPAPFVIGLRPGYSYRLAISGVPEFPGEIFYATLEARGSLLLGNRLRNVDFPAALVFTEEDFLKVRPPEELQKRVPATLKKVIVLERPETAEAIATRPDEPLEIQLPAGRDPLFEARDRGQPLLVLYMGERKLAPEEMINLPGTILLPGEKVLPLPKHAPWLDWKCQALIDPLAGSLPQSAYFAIPDGGDVGLPAGFGRDGKLKGLDPSDTVAEYKDSRGRHKLAVSNRIALCIPRFMVLKNESAPFSQVALLGPGTAIAQKGPIGLTADVPALENAQKQQLEAMSSRIKASSNVQTLGTSVTGRIDNLIVTAHRRITNTLDGHCPPPVAPEPADGPLVIIKWPDKTGALVGDLLTFTLKYTNTGGQPITDIVVSDNLTTRFEYEPGTAKADREAIFTTQPNNVGSSILRWEIPGTLLPRESGLVTFQVRVR